MAGLTLPSSQILLRCPPWDFGLPLSPKFFTPSFPPTTSPPMVLPLMKLPPSTSKWSQTLSGGSSDASCTTPNNRSVPFPFLHPSWDSQARTRQPCMDSYNCLLKALPCPWTCSLQTCPYRRQTNPIKWKFTKFSQFLDSFPNHIFIFLKPGCISQWMWMLNVTCFPSASPTAAYNVLSLLRPRRSSWNVRRSSEGPSRCWPRPGLLVAPLAICWCPFYLQ